MGWLVLSIFVLASAATPPTEVAEPVGEPDECADVDLSHHEEDLDTLEFSLLQTSLRLDREESHHQAVLPAATPSGVLAGARRWRDSLCHAGLGYWLCDHHRPNAQSSDFSTPQRLLDALSEIRTRSGVPVQVFLFFGLLTGTLVVFIFFAKLTEHSDKREKSLGLVSGNMYVPIAAPRAVAWSLAKGPWAAAFGAARARMEGRPSLLSCNARETLSGLSTHKSPVSLSHAAASIHAASLSTEEVPDESQPSLPLPPPLCPVALRACDSTGVRPQPRPAPWDQKVGGVSSSMKATRPCCEAPAAITDPGSLFQREVGYCS